jgi:hypothetical protein
MWVSCFKAAARATGIDTRSAAALATTPALQRLFVNSFKPARAVPSASDFAVSFAFELRQDYGPEIGLSLSSAKIRHFAVNVRRRWLETIIESPLLRERFKDVRDSHPAAAISVGASCMPEFEPIIEDRLSLLRLYFAGFTTTDATETVYVWLPDADDIVHSDPARRDIVPVALDTSQGADRGFFRVGYNYSLADAEPMEWLHVCYLNASRLMEAGQFGKRVVGQHTGHVLWIR